MSIARRGLPTMVSGIRLRFSSVIFILGTQKYKNGFHSQPHLAQLKQIFWR